MAAWFLLTPVHIALAIFLFFIVNNIGKHAEEFGYATSSLFEETTENVALNLFIKAMAPTVFTIVISAILVATNMAEWRHGIFMMAVYYYLFRALFVVLWGRTKLVRWWRFFGTAILGIGAAWLAYTHLILPNRSLLPDLDQWGNELWIAILVFLYAVANKIPTKSGPRASQTNDYVTSRYRRFAALYSSIIDRFVGGDPLLELTVYSVLIYEDYCRPRPMRIVERLLRRKTTGVMQVGSNRPLGDRESVEIGNQILSNAWATHSHEEWPSDQVRRSILMYNRDSDYADRVLEVMEIIAKRSDRRFEDVYDRRYNRRQNPQEMADAVIEARRKRLADLQSALFSAQYRGRNKKVRPVGAPTVPLRVKGARLPPRSMPL
jgi:hypothetical protein